VIDVTEMLKNTVYKGAIFLIIEREILKNPKCVVHELSGTSTIPTGLFQRNIFSFCNARMVIK